MKNFKNYLIVFLLGLMIPMALGYLYQVPGLNITKSDIIPNDSDSTMEVAKAKLQNLYDADIKDYQRLKNLEAKYSKANDILAKMMTIFLADLGLRISKNDIVDMVAESQAELPQASSSKESTARHCPKPTEQKSCPSLSEMAKDEGYKLVPHGDPKDKKWIKNEAKLSSLSESETGDFLKSVEIKNFFDEIRSTQKAGRKVLNTMNGTFEGILTYDSPDRAPADISIEIDADLEDEKIVGDYTMKLSRNGKPFSNSQSNGSLNHFKKSEGSEGLFLDMGGKTGFLQLYFINGRNTLVGNYYRQTDVSSFEKEGTVKIYRR